MTGYHITFTITEEAAAIIKKIPRGDKSKFVSDLITKTQPTAQEPKAEEKKPDFSKRCYFCQRTKFLFRINQFRVCITCRDEKIANGQYDALGSIVPNKEEFENNGRPNPIETTVQQSSDSSRDVIEIPIHGDN